jgi:predicted dehydrogenase
MGSFDSIPRRTFLKTAAAGAVVTAASGAPGRKIKTGVIGCGSVSGSYLPHMVKSPYIELVSVCDIVVERAERAAKKFNVPHSYPNVDRMLAGADFEFLVNLTSMPSHFPVNKKGLEAGKHVWSEKPLATEVPEAEMLLDLAHKKGVKLWGAPTVVTSPQFAFMAKTLNAGKLGTLAGAHAAYGHEGHLWSAWFFQKKGGSLYDLGVYNVTTLTGLLGPAKAVVGMTGIGTPERTLTDGTRVKVEVADNEMLLIDHGNAVFSHIQSGYNYGATSGHSGKTADYSIDINGSKGRMHLVGYDWAPHGVDLATLDKPEAERYEPDPKGYLWQWGASYTAECLATGRESPITAEHALHVLEVMNACHKSQETGRRIPIRSTFKYPVIV